MPTVRIVIEIETGEAAKTSIRLEQPQSSARVTRTGVGAIKARVHRLVNEFSSNERTVVKAVLQASVQNTKVYREQLMADIGFDQLLQFNGVLAWITRKYRKLVGEPDSWLVETVYDPAKDDYYLQIQPETSEEVLIALKASFELG